jgi:uncharacterized protein
LVPAKAGALCLRRARTAGKAARVSASVNLFAVSTREFVRRPGASRRIVSRVPAPARLGFDVVAVPVGSPLELELLLESVIEGVLVTGRVRATALGACVRCLDDVELPLDVSVQELFVYPERAGGVRESGDEQDGEQVLVGEIADMEPAVRDAVVLALPFQPVCQEDCPGLCSECGARLAETPGHHHEVRDPRWSALAALVDQGEES